MLNLPDLRIDRFSFWLGFLAASLVWWLYLRIRPYFPQWREGIKQSIRNLRQKSFAGIEEYLRREAVRRSQRLHLAAPLFPLDDILIQPRLIAPPAFQGNEGRPAAQSIASQVIPYLPDWPELLTPLGVPTITPIDSVKSGRNIAIIGQPGCGKTVVLAHLACEISRRFEEVDLPGSPIPLMAHILDLDPNLDEGSNPLENLMKRISAQASVVMQPQVLRYLQAVFKDKSRRMILLVDGLDELPPDRLKAAVRYLNIVNRQNPRLQMVVTASPEYMDGLTKAGFYPLSVTSWGMDEREQLIHKWGDIWTGQLLPEIKKQVDVKEIDPKLYDFWLGGDPSYFTPLEWTLRLWGAFAGDLSGSLPMGILDNYISRYLPNGAFIPALETLAHTMVQKSVPCLSFDEMERILSSFKLHKPPVPAEVEGGEQAVETAIQAEVDQKPRKKSRRDIVSVSQGEQIITALINGGVLVEHSNSQIRFSNPVFLGFLAGMKITPEEAAEMVKNLNWVSSNLALQYSTACSDDVPWIYQMFDQPVQPLFRDMMIAARWLRDAPSTADWRSSLMRSLISMIQIDYLPFGARARCAAAFLLIRDPSIIKLFKQLLTSKSDIVRRLALLGSGATGNQQLLNDISNLLADSVTEVRLTACLALTALPGDVALNSVVNILLSGTEELRQAAAEGLAKLPGEGHKLLEEAATVDDLLTRRAAVFGLLQVREPWARQVLEKVAVEDGQWVVRNAAGQALEALQNDDRAIPNLLPPPSESAWLLTYASKLGIGILPGQPATDALMMALTSEAFEDKINAIQYLQENPDEGVIRELYHIIFSTHEALYEPALYALWWISTSGFPLPSPRQFGLG